MLVVVIKGFNPFKNNVEFKAARLRKVFQKNQI
jgi:hypothetical protein